MSIDVSGAQRLARRQPTLGRARSGPEGTQQLGHLADGPGPGRPRGGRGHQVSSRRCRNAARCHSAVLRSVRQEVHGDGPAAVDLAEHPVERDPDVVVEDLRIRSPCIVSIGRTVIPGLSMSTNSAVIPRCADSASPVRVRSTHRGAYWARLVHTFWPLTRQPSSMCAARQTGTPGCSPVPGRRIPDTTSRRRSGPAAPFGRVSPRARSRSSSARAPRAWSRGRAARRSPHGERLAQVGPQKIEPPRPPTRSGHPRRAPAGVVGQAAHLAQVVDLLVQRAEPASKG